MAKKATTKKPVGAGDFGKAIEALKAASKAARNGEWTEVMTQIFTFFDEYRQTLAGQPMTMGAGEGGGLKFECPSDDDCCDVEDVCNEIDEFCKKHNAAPKAEGEHATVGAGAFDWATLIPLLLQLIAAWRNSSPS